jgi:hypothetical protein
MNVNDNVLPKSKGTAEENSVIMVQWIEFTRSLSVLRNVLRRLGFGRTQNKQWSIILVGNHIRILRIHFKSVANYISAGWPTVFVDGTKYNICGSQCHWTGVPIPSVDSLPLSLRATVGYSTCWQCLRFSEISVLNAIRLRQVIKLTWITKPPIANERKTPQPSYRLKF